MSNIPKPHHLEELLEAYSSKLEHLGSQFNPVFSQVSLDLKNEVDQLKNRIEKYAGYSREKQLEHVNDADHISKEVELVHGELTQIESKIMELEKIFNFGHNLL